MCGHQKIHNLWNPQGKKMCWPYCIFNNRYLKVKIAKNSLSPSPVLTRRSPFWGALNGFVMQNPVILLDWPIAENDPVWINLEEGSHFRSPPRPSQWCAHKHPQFTHRCLQEKLMASYVRPHKALPLCAPHCNFFLVLLQMPRIANDFS